jgi:hypothetical protein
MFGPHVSVRAVLGGAIFAAAVIAFFWVGTLAGVVAGLHPLTDVGARMAQTTQR